MPKPLIEDELWSIIEPLLPRRRKRPKKGRGRPRVLDRAALTGIVFVLRSGIPWKMLPREMGCGSGVTCWRRLKAGQRAWPWVSTPRSHGAAHRTAAAWARPAGWWSAPLLGCIGFVD